MSDELWKSLRAADFLDWGKKMDSGNWPCCMAVMVLIHGNLIVGTGLGYTFMSAPKLCSLQ